MDNCTTVYVLVFGLCDLPSLQNCLLVPFVFGNTLFCGQAVVIQWWLVSVLRKMLAMTVLFSCSD